MRSDDGRFEVDTPVGRAEVALYTPPRPVSQLVLGHGAGGGVDAVDLVAVRNLAVASGVAVARVVQPYRVAGRRAPAPARQLDAAWLAVLTALRSRDGCQDLPVVAGGRSSGARVACRTAVQARVAGLVALAFPLHPPGRPERTRADELNTGIPTIVVNGDRDPFGVPEPRPGIQVEVLIGGDHSLRGVTDRVAALVVGWLSRHGWARST
ncbi:MAG TPA: alpha/beta family hydrolase [Micromonosporaceae bacterium]